MGVYEELGVPLEYVRVHATDSDMTPVDLGAYSSRETFMVGNACVMAATDLRKRITGVIAEAWETSAAWKRARSRRTGICARSR